MAVARIGAVFLAASLSVAGAQQPPQTQLTIQVTDRTGASVRGARIAIDPPPIASKSILTTDTQGQSTVDLPAGSYTLSIAASGFSTLTKRIEVQGESGQTITAALEVGATGCEPCIVAVFLPDFPLGTPEPVFLPVRPVSNFAPLPSHSPQKRWLADLLTR